jgi:hypothetical protein
MRLEALRLWRLIGRDGRWCRNWHGQSGCGTVANAITKRCSRAFTMRKRAGEALREGTRANVRSWAALPQSRRSVRISGSR